MHKQMEQWIDVSLSLSNKSVKKLIIEDVDQEYY